MEWIKQRFSIIGMARSGIAAAEKVVKAGGSVFLSDAKKAEDIAESDYLLEHFDCEFGGNTDRVLDADVIILSPGVPQTIPIVKKAMSQHIPVISEIEFAFRIMNKSSKIIAVTGSNGKSTTVSLIYHLLVTAGFKTLLAGNIGDAFSSFDIENHYDWIVLELSSFQLELIDQFTPDIAILTNITPDHLNRYNSFDDYALAKINLFKNQNNHHKAVLFADDEVINKFRYLIKSNIENFSLIHEADAFYNQETSELVSDKDGIEWKMSINDFSIRGPHNYCNIMAAFLAVRDIIADDEVLRRGFKTFKSLEHRLEWVDTVNGVQFINDSKATNTDSVKYALLSYERPIRIIMGGSDKGEDFTILNELLKEHARKIYLIGATRKQMEEAYQGIAEYEVFDDFESAIVKAYQDSEAGDYVVLSPACASYDMFKNFEHRGQSFKEIVRKIKNGL